MQTDAVLFLVSQTYLSGRRFKTLSSALERACPIPCTTVRAEGVGESLAAALDRLAGAGARNILVQPIGLPFSDSIMAWLPGALSQWQRAFGSNRTRVRLAPDQLNDSGLIGQLVENALVAARSAKTIDPDHGSADGAGWDEVPEYRHHLIVCTGPRCNFRGSGSLRSVLRDELARTGLAKSCLVATTGCLCPCNKGPVVAHYPAGRWYRLADPDAVSRFVSTVLEDGSALPELVIHEVTT